MANIINLDAGRWTFKEGEPVEARLVIDISKLGAIVARARKSKKRQATGLNGALIVKLK